MRARKKRLRADIGDVEKDFFTEPNGPIGSSLAPQEIDQFEDLDREYRVLGPELVARRVRLRRIVAGIVGVASVVSVLVGVRLALQSSRAESAAPILAAQPAVASIDVPMDTPIPPPAAPVAAPQEEPAADSIAKSSDEDDNAPALDVARARQAKNRVLLAIEQGRYSQAITLGRTAIDADPADAEIYLLLGTALQETGQWKRAAQVFSECSGKAKRGPVGECMSLTRR
jgi:tetratricopeptide (TPR) repeat protein